MTDLLNPRRYASLEHIWEGRRSTFKGSIIYITDKAEFIIIEVSIMKELGQTLHQIFSYHILVSEVLSKYLLCHTDPNCIPSWPNFWTT
jgi:hypothetical protein